jgi:hypothetical protein
MVKSSQLSFVVELISHAAEKRPCMIGDETIT